MSGGKRRSITAIQKAVLSWIAQRRREGTPATYQDIADEFGWRSVSTARDHIRALARKGLLRQAGKARSLQVTDEGERLASVVSPQAPLRKNEFPLSSQAIEALEPLLVKRRFKAGSFLWVSGDLPKFLIRIDRGRVRISRPVGAQKSINIYEFSEGDIFGFLPLLDGEPYPADALVIEDLECSILSRSALLAALRSNPELTISLLQILGRRFRGAFEKV